MKEGFENIWEDFVVLRGAFLNISKAYHPPVNLFELEDAFVLQVAISCASMETVRVAYGEGVVTVHGARVERETFNNRKYHLMEIHYGPFERKVFLPGKVDAEHIKIAYADGMMTITLPKTNAAE